MPLSCQLVNGKPFLSYQLSYFEKNGIFNIYVVIHADDAHKVLLMLRETFSAD